MIINKNMWTDGICVLSGRKMFKKKSMQTIIGDRSNKNVVTFFLKTYPSQFRERFSFQLGLHGCTQSTKSARNVYCFPGFGTRYKYKHYGNRGSVSMIANRCRVLKIVMIKWFPKSSAIKITQLKSIAAVLSLHAVYNIHVLNSIRFETTNIIQQDHQSDRLPTVPHVYII